MSDRSASDGRDASCDGLVPRTGQTRAGVPLSLNRAPAEDLAPWVARMVAAKIEASESNRIACGMLNDVPYVRSLIGGSWTAQTAGGLQRCQQQALLFGPQSKLMAVNCTGEIYTAGFGLRPGALYALAGIKGGEILDQIMPCDRIGLAQTDFAGLFSPDDDPEVWLCALENALRQHIAMTDAREPDPISTHFHLAAFADPNLSVHHYAEDRDIGMKRLERIVKRDFGLTPKQVLRRARALDMASQLCGVADSDEESELLLRYSDQSHQIREFMAFFGLTPSQFRMQAKPLLTLNLEARQAQRLEELDRIDPGGPRPWRKD